MEIKPKKPRTKRARRIEIRAGDSIYTPPGEWHWHSATPGDFMAHLAMWEALNEGQQGPETKWDDHVTGAGYPGRQAG